MGMKSYCLIIFIFLIQSTSAFCQDTATTTAKQTQSAATNKAKGWFRRHRKPKIEETKQRALNIPTGSQVKVTSTDGTKLKGQLTSVTNDELGVKTGKGAVRNLSYDKISSLKKVSGSKLGGYGMSKGGNLNASLAKVPEEAPVNLKLTDKTKISGRYLGQDANGIKIQTPQGDKMVDRTIPSDQIASIKPEKPGLFSKPKFQAPDLVKKSISGVPVGSPLDVKMPNGKNVSGKLAGVTDTGFAMQSLEGGKIVNEDLSYDQVAGVKRPNLGIKQRIPGLHPPALQSAPQLKAAAMDIPAGSLVTMQMPDGSKSTGKLMGVTNDGMQVQSLEAGNVVTQKLGFDQIGSIQQGAPVTATDRAKKYGTSAALVVVTGVVSGFIGGAISKVRK